MHSQGRLWLDESLTCHFHFHHLCHLLPRPFITRRRRTACSSGEGGRKVKAVWHSAYCGRASDRRCACCGGSGGARDAVFTAALLLLVMQRCCPRAVPAVRAVPPIASAIMTCCWCCPCRSPPSRRPLSLGRTLPHPPAAQVWEAAAPLGLKSKRFTKQMLQELRDAGWVKTQPLQAGKKHKSFGYRLNQTMQQQRAAAETRQAAGSAA